MEKNNKPKFLNIALALLCLWFAIVLYSFLMGFSGVLTVNDYTFEPWGQIRYTTLYIWTPWLLLCPLVLYIGTNFPILPHKKIRGSLLHLGWMLVLAILHGYISASLYYYIGDIEPAMQEYAPWQHTGHFLFQDDMFLVDGFIYSVLVASQNVSHFYQLAKQKELDAVRIEHELLESKLRSLKMQINPHFLFNTLNSISVLIKKKEFDKAGTMISRLSDFFRETLEEGNEQMVPLKKELSLIEHYLEIEKVRFGERLSIEYKLESEALKINVPVLLLQPLVENAIKHGLSKKAGNCSLIISAQKVKNTLEVSIEDDGIGTSKTVEACDGLGLTNVQSRLEVIYGERQQFSFVSSPDSGTKIKITLPDKVEINSPAGIKEASVA